MTKESAIRLQVFRHACGVSQAEAAEQHGGIGQPNLWAHEHGRGARTAVSLSYDTWTGGFVAAPHWGQVIRDTPATRASLLAELKSSVRATEAVARAIRIAAARKTKPTEAA